MGKVGLGPGEFIETSIFLKITCKLSLPDD